MLIQWYTFCPGRFLNLSVAFPFMLSSDFWHRFTQHRKRVIVEKENISRMTQETQAAPLKTSHRLFLLFANSLFDCRLFGFERQREISETCGEQEKLNQCYKAHKMMTSFSDGNLPCTKNKIYASFNQSLFRNTEPEIVYILTRSRSMVIC